jgi:CheY-like chemotaxis protein
MPAPWFAPARIPLKEPVMPARHILIADDDDSVRALLARVCVRIYPSVGLSAVKDGLEALTVFSHNPADLVITNANMPGLDGLSLIRALRAQQLAVPILMISANAALERAALAAGATRFLEKPIQLDLLRQTLIDLLPP